IEIHPDKVLLKQANIDDITLWRSDVAVFATLLLKDGPRSSHSGSHLIDVNYSCSPH
ncbi:MAG: hypothetical protein RL701_7680, partial [Pseudomonadota bacterium]